MSNDEPLCLTPRAKADILTSGWSYIDCDSEKAADRVDRAFYDAGAFLAAALMRYHTRPDFTNRSLRLCTLTRYPDYAVVYRPETAPFISLPSCIGKEIAAHLKQRE